MLNPKRFCTPLLVLAGAVAFGACQDAPTDPNNQEASGPALDHLDAGEQVCETIDFSAFSHGDSINSLSAFHTTLSVATVGDDPHSEDQARGYDTGTDGGPDPDLEAANDCSDCEGLGIVMIIGDDRGFGPEGDSPSGGTITITGFPSEGETFVDAFKGIDHDSVENPIELFVDGTNVGETTAQGDGTVQTVDVTKQNISEEVEFVFGGSGAVDDIEVCHTPPGERGAEGCTPGYWRQPHHFDSWPDAWTDGDGQPDVGFCEVFDCPASLALQRPERGDINDISLHDAVVLRGGGVNALARHAAAAALNAHPDTDVDYFYTLSEVQTNVGDALSSGEFESVKDELEHRNEEVCPLN